MTPERLNQIRAMSKSIIVDELLAEVERLQAIIRQQNRQLLDMIGRC